jgi:hypothetical protein
MPAGVKNCPLAVPDVPHFEMKARLANTEVVKISKATVIAKASAKRRGLPKNAGRFV